MCIQSLRFNFPCYNNSKEPQTWNSVILRSSAIGLGMIALIVGVIHWRNMPELGGLLAAGGAVVTSSGVCLRCVESPRDVTKHPYWNFFSSCQRFKGVVAEFQKEPNNGQKATDLLNCATELRQIILNPPPGFPPTHLSALWTKIFCNTPLLHALDEIMPAIPSYRRRPDALEQKILQDCRDALTALEKYSVEDFRYY